MGILRHFRAFSTPEQNPALGVLSRPDPPPLTQTVGRQIKEQKQNRLCIASVVFRLAQKENSLFEFGHLLAVVLAGFYFWFTSVLAFNLLGFQI